MTPRRLRRLRTRRQALGDEEKALRILHFDPPIRHQFVRPTLRIGRRPVDKPRALQIAHAGRQSSGMFTVFCDHLLQPRHVFIHLQSEQMFDRVLPNPRFFGALVGREPQHARGVEFRL